MPRTNDRRLDSLAKPLSFSWAELLPRLLSLACGIALLWAIVGCGTAHPAATSPPATSSPGTTTPTDPGATTTPPDGGSTSTPPADPGNSTDPGSPAPPADPAPPPPPVLDIHGHLQAGVQPVAGAHVYLYAANHTGYGAASLWLLTPGAPDVNGDALGPYVLTDAAGGFDLTGRYGCIPGQLVYLLAQGGSPGSASAPANPALALMSVVGTCPAEGHFPTDTILTVNQVSTVATAYALAGFMIDPGHLSAASTANAGAGMSNAFATAASLVDPTTGTARADTPEGNGVIPQAEINTLANLLVPCTVSASPSSCSSLFALTRDNAAHAAADTANATLNLARNPGANAAALFALAAGGPFAPALSAAPTDWSLAVTFYAPNMAGPYFPAFDAAGNLWVPGFANNSLTEFSPTGDLLSGEAGFTGGALAQPFAVAIDPRGNAWISNFGLTTPNAPSVSEFAANGAALTPTGFGCGTRCTFLALDANNTVWVSGSPQVTTLKPSGAALSAFATNGFEAGLAIDKQGRGWTLGSGRTLARLTLPATVASFPESVTAAAGNDLAPLAIDSSDTVWFVSNQTSTLGHHGSDGNALSPAGGYTGGGLNAPTGIAIDGSNRVWISNRGSNSVSAFLPDGTAVTGHGGYTADGVSSPRGIAVDPSGNLWITNFTSNSVTEFVGLATPTATPILPGNHGQRP